MGSRHWQVARARGPDSQHVHDEAARGTLLRPADAAFNAQLGGTSTDTACGPGAVCTAAAAAARWTRTASAPPGRVLSLARAPACTMIAHADRTVGPVVGAQ
eukprot:8365084-Heterocapsa_arctica.AAC.1